MNVAANVPRSDTSILVIEDDPVAGEIFGRILRETGYSVHVAADAESGLAHLAHTVPAAILLDLRLPTIDGLELLRRIRAHAQLARVPVAIITGDYFVDHDVAGRLDALRAQIHFKPIWEKDLIRIVRDLCASP